MSLLLQPLREGEKDIFTIEEQANEVKVGGTTTSPISTSYATRGIGIKKI
jgi:hypothetical protein